MKLFRRNNTPHFDPSTADIELLVFECTEVSASEPMQRTVVDCCEQLGLAHRVIDVWLDPDAVVRHGLLLAPAVIVLADGVEVDRLVGPRSCRQVERFVNRVLGNTAAAPRLATA